MNDNSLEVASKKVTARSEKPLKKSKKMINILEKILRKTPKWIPKQIFGFLMRFESFNTRIEKRLIPKFLSEDYIEYFYNLWWIETQKYNPSSYTQYQKKYWDTLGQYRWANSNTYNYSDILSNISISRGTLLELGCGKGDLLRAINISFPDIKTFAIDASEKMCEYARVQSPNSIITCGFYGPKYMNTKKLYDIVIARSTLTYIDEIEIQQIIEWIVSITKQSIIISEPSGKDDYARSPKDFNKINDYTYKRICDHSHIRDYSRMKPLQSLSLHKCELETFNNGGNRLWVFSR